MGDKMPVGDRKMSVTDFSDPLVTGTWAKQWSKDLLRKEHRGPGDTIEAAAERLRKRRSLDPNILLQGWNREPRDMMVSRWLPLFAAWWQEVGCKAEGSYISKRAEAEGYETHPLLLRLADTLAGHVVAEEDGKEEARER